MLVDYIINPSWTECPNCGNISSSPNAYRTICPVCHYVYSTTANYLKLEADKTFIDDSKEELVEIEDRVVYTLQDKEQEWEAYEEDGIFYVKGKAVDRLMGRINIEDNESMYYLQKSIKNMGIEDKLKELGVCEGDTVKISDWDLEWYE